MWRSPTILSNSTNSANSPNSANLTNCGTKRWRRKDSKISSNTILTILLVQIQILHKNLLHLSYLYNISLDFDTFNDNWIYCHINHNCPNRIPWILSLFYLHRATFNFKVLWDFILPAFWSWDYCCCMDTSFTMVWACNLWDSCEMDNYAEKNFLWLVNINIIDNNYVKYINIIYL